MKPSQNLIVNCMIFSKVMVQSDSSHMGVFCVVIKLFWLKRQPIRETVPPLTSDMGKKTVSVLAHSFFLSQKDNSGYILSISPLMYSRS